MHWRRVVDLGCGRDRPVRRYGVRGGREEQDDVPFHADVDKGDGRPVSVSVREHVAAGDSAR